MHFGRSLPGFWGSSGAISPEIWDVLRPARCLKMRPAETSSGYHAKETGMRDRSNDIRSTDELDLAIETLKDLTPSATVCDQVKGGNTGIGRRCECGTA